MTLAINPDPQMTLVELGDEQRCLVIDNFLSHPEHVVARACDLQDSFLYPERAYPGGVLPLTPRYVESLHRFIRREMSRIFPFSRGGMEVQSQLCLTTLQPADFTWVQRLCHTDPGQGAGRANYAALLYLFSDEELGGTAFFRWRDEAYWQRMTARQQPDPEAGLEELQRKFQLFREPPRYMTDSNEAGELLQRIAPKFNRFIFYSGDIPHSADICYPEKLSSDPRSGRLTLNTFVSARPQ